MNKKNLLIIFTRNLELGKVKTRLAKSIGNQAAYDIYKLLLLKTKEVTQHINCDKVVFYSENIIKNDIWEPNIYEKKLQSGSDLGIKMKNAFESAFNNQYEKVLIIGSDLYDLQSNHINEAFKKLNDNKVVIGPALDGGYYLLGLKRIIPKLFINKNWGTSSVFSDTINDLEKMKFHLLPELNDIDVIEDLEHHPAFTKFLKLL